MNKSNITFNNVCDFLGNEDNSNIDDLSTLLGYGLLITPLAFIGNINDLIGAFGLLDAKNELINIVKRIALKLRILDEKDYSKRFKKMENAYGLICYTAFFDSLNDGLSTLYKELKFKRNFKINLTDLAIQNIDSLRKSNKQVIIENSSEIDVPILNPSEGLVENLKILADFYEKLVKSFSNLIKQTNLWEEAAIKEEDLRKVNLFLNKLPKIACNCFKEQYFYLCSEYNEFFFWTNIVENKVIYKELKGSSESIKKILQTTEKMSDKVDVGFNELTTQLKSLIKKQAQNEIELTLEEIHNYYMHQINNQIIMDEYSFENQADKITLPRIKDIFITQSFKLLSYNNTMQIEDRRLWVAKKEYHDIGLYIVNYLLSHFSFEIPLIILGEPGSGKSLLTQMLASGIINTNLTTIRIKLRDVNINRPINEQIEQEINRITKRDINWARFTSYCKQKPILLLLDGFDELLQIDYLTARKYLLEIQKFQRDELIIERTPVRVIITSRLNLIHKAILPHNSIILKIQPFDDNRINKWVSIWNKTNAQHEYLIERFKDLTDKESPSYQFLEQPLLLLMYVILKSSKDETADKNITQKTTLYYNLIRLFIERELKKEYDPVNLTEQEFNNKIQLELKKLGIISLGMLIREKYEIRISELNNDLTYFGMENYQDNLAKNSVVPADIILSRFFFVYESTSKSENDFGKPIHPVYEFLHPTFMEFLATNFIIEVILDEVISLSVMKEDNHLRTKYERQINSIQEFSKEWFACLAHFPLFTLSNLLALFKDWFPLKLEEKNINHQEFMNLFNICFNNHLELLMFSNQLLDFLEITKEMKSREKPMLHSLADYSINLVLLKSIFEKKNKYVFEKHESNANKELLWDKLTHIWRAAYPFEQLIAVTELIKAFRIEGGVEVHLKLRTDKDKEENLQPVAMNINRAFSDIVAANLDEEMQKFRAELKEAKEEAERLDKLKTEFLAQMSHEIRTPINTIFGFTSILKDTLSTKLPAEQGETFQIINAAGQRIIRTIDLILEMSQIQSKNYEFFPIIFDLKHETLENLVSRYKRYAIRKNLEFDFVDEASNRIIYADKHMVDMIFSNLIENAIRFTNEGNITIKIYNNNPTKVSVDVIDTGIGISKEYQKNIFTPFSQEDRGFTRKFEGNGLGLAIVKSYCELNNAKIKLNSKKNIGTKVSIEFDIQIK